MDEKHHNIRHSLAHVLAAAVLEFDPKAQLGIGPVIENGFYYDFLFSKKVTDEDLPKLEEKMIELVKQNLDFLQKKVGFTEAKEIFKDQPFKLELIKDLEKYGTTDANEIKKIEDKSLEATKATEVKLYQTGSFTDLCRGGHVENTKEINPEGFKLLKLAGAYWRGDEKNAQLVRIYSLAFNIKKELEDYLVFLEEAKKRDHKKLGIELDLFTFSDLVGSGLPLWTPRGTLIRNLLDDYVWQLRKEKGYVQVDIPHITKKDLYEKSGHWAKFKDELFKITTREGHIFALKPMNCPHHTQIFARKNHSYREMPQRYANTTKMYRDEQTGELSGLSRVRSITIDDAHVFCRKSQIKEEAVKIWDIIHTFYKSFGFKLDIRLSLHDPKNIEKYLGDKELWQVAEDTLRQIIKEKNAEFVEAEGEAAFYGPKIDFIAKDSLGREWQVATIQLDMNMPERFDLYCINEKGEKERIVMLHAAIMGSIERFLSIILEHFAGALPLWLSPVQVKILTINDQCNNYAKELERKLKDSEIRAELDEKSETLNKKILESEKLKIPYIVVIGKKEIESGKLAVRERGKKEIAPLTAEEFTEILGQKIKEKK